MAIEGIEAPSTRVVVKTIEVSVAAVNTRVAQRVVDGMWVNYCGQVPNDRGCPTLSVDPGSNAESPPNKEAFVAADDAERLILISEAWHKQTDKVLVGNEQTRGLADWRESILDYYKEDPDVEVVSGDEFKR